MSEQKQTPEEERELLETPNKDEDFVEPTGSEDEARRSERRRSYQEEKAEISREVRKDNVEDQPEVPEDVVGRLDRPASREETVEGEEDVPSDVVARLDRGEE